MLEIRESSFICVICDFGVARLVGNAAPVAGLNVPKNEAITIRYTPPEVFKRLADKSQSEYMLGEIDKSIDVYAYAVSMFEVVTGSIFMKGIKAPDLVVNVVKGHRMDFEAVPCLPGTSWSITQGWSQLAQNRPIMKAIVEAVNSDLYALEERVRSGEFTPMIWSLPIPNK